MTDDAPREGFSLRRWSARKHAAAREERAATSEVDVPPVAPSAVEPAPPAPLVPHEPEPPVAALPPVESLTPESDFAPFMRPDVDPALKRAALKKLFSDPHFNVMDGLDVYIDDYTKPDPIEPDLLKRLVQTRYVFDPPKTRVNEQGFVEDVPPSEKPLLETSPQEEQAALPLAPPGEAEPPKTE